jgi:NAD(P)H-dependent FMN reductase
MRTCAEPLVLAGRVPQLLPISYRATPARRRADLCVGVIGHDRMPWNISEPHPVCTDVDKKHCIRVLAISGSLRRSSSNTALVRAAAQLAPQVVDLSIYTELGALPPFNPDLDKECAPETVTRFRDQLQACEAVLIASPEYAHGVPGVLKNALDWVVGSGELVDKPIAVINASPRATHAWMSLKETLLVMSARLIAAASITIPLDGRALDAKGIASDARLSAALRTAVGALVFAVREARPIRQGA